MKTNDFVCLFFTAMMVLAACTEEKIVYIEKSHGIELQPGEGIIELSVASNLTTRAARPVVSSEADNNVNRVAFKFFSHNYNEVDLNSKIVGVYSSDGSIAYHENDDKVKIVNLDGDDGGSLLVFNGEGADNVLNNESGLILKLNGLTASNDFKIVAYGYNQSEGTETDLSGISNKSDECYFQYTVKGDDIENHIDEEIFAGYVQVIVNQFGKLDKEGYELTLERQVAGALAYFSNVPVYIKNDKNENCKVAKITVSTGLHIYEGGINFPASLMAVAENSSDEKYNGYIANNRGEYEKSDLLTFDLTGNGVQGGNNYGDHYTFTDGFLLAEEVKESYDYSGEVNPFGENDDVLFGGCFLCPFNNAQGTSVGITVDGIIFKSTLNIVYYDEQGKVIKAVPLKLVTAEEGYNDYYYNIRRNHFYSMGDLTGGPLDVDPGSGTDELKLFLSDAWTKIPLTNEQD